MAHPTNLQNPGSRRYGRWVVDRRGLGHHYWDSVNLSAWIDRDALADGDVYFHLTRKRFLSQHDRETLPAALAAALKFHGLKPGFARFVPHGCDDRTILARHFPREGAAL